MVIRKNSEENEQFSDLENDSNFDSISNLFDPNEYPQEDKQEDETSLENGFMESEFKTKPFGDNGQYITGMWRNNCLIELQSFQIYHSSSNKIIYLRKQKTSYLLTIDDEEFVARVNIDKFYQLNSIMSLINLKQKLLENLIIYRIIEDSLQVNRDRVFSNLKNLLEEISHNTVYNIENAEDIFQISSKLKIWKNMPIVSILNDIIKNKSFSQNFRNIIEQLLNIEKQLNLRKSIFFKTNIFQNNFNLFEFFEEICQKSINNHRIALLKKYKKMQLKVSSSLTDNLSKLDDWSILFISNRDMILFFDLIEITNDSIFLEFLNDSWNDLFKSLKAIMKQALKQNVVLKTFVPLTHPLWLYLCKSFQEIIKEICICEDIAIGNLLKKSVFGFGGWIIKKRIKWSKISHLNQSLEKQFQILFELIKYFKPGYSKNNKFPYKVKRLESIFQDIENFSTVHEENLVWIYILDNAIANIILNEQIEFFKPSLIHYLNFIKNTTSNHYESFRIVTHNTIRFIVQTVPYLKNQVSETDKTILQLQIESIKNISTVENTNTSKIENLYRDLIDVYTAYWMIKESVIDKIPEKFPYGNFENQMKDIGLKLLNTVNNVLVKNSDAQDLIKYFRSFIEFVEDINALEFHWFIKDIDDISIDDIYLVNKETETYRIINPDLFIQKYDNLPRHYLIEIITDLLDCVTNFLSTKVWSVNDQVNATSELFSAIRKSFLYLKEQPNYISFDSFKIESNEPFLNAVKNCNCYEDFKKRIGIIGESFWYLRKQDEIDIKTALELYKNLNESIDIEILESCYDIYLQKFNFYIQKTVNKSYNNRISFIVQEINASSKILTFNQWDTEFKRNTIPEILAGFAAVWSIQRSKDIENTRKILKPHCIQILCILRLLSVDKSYNGIDKQLIQVLTGQGKSLILALLSAVLALTGHKIRTVCYSDYLVERDEQDFTDYFECLTIQNQITFSTFENMALLIISPKINGKITKFRDLIKNLILTHDIRYKKPIAIDQCDMNCTILLIDEVDVFFSKDFYGNCCVPCFTIYFKALVKIQENIWQLVNLKFNKYSILNEIDKFIENHKNQSDFKELIEFKQKTGTFYLLKFDDSGKIVKTIYTNQSLYEEQLDKMIDDATNVAENVYADEFGFKINDIGLITSMESNGIYSNSNYCNFRNIFYYFKLKKQNYDNMNYKNYGYFLVETGIISYSKLPEEFPLILGVSGTLTTLNNFEQKIITDCYSINNCSLMPSFFGHTKLKFNAQSDFLIKVSKNDWLDTIINHTETQIKADRSVIIFMEEKIFSEENTKMEFVSKFDRFHILTQNTEDHTRIKYIEEAGIKKTVTIATKQMGRGVDFKSSVTVEKNGGIHVIQTFFSLDIKEETQIKGRTARKDNNGSYELILCEEHLIDSGFLIETTTDYETLDEQRKEKIQKQEEEITDKFKRSEEYHETSMNYFKYLLNNEM